MNYLSVEQLSTSYNEVPLFNDLTFGVSQGQKIALIGRNGCGKSTLLRIIAGIEQPDKGTVVFRKGIKVAFLSQNPDFGVHQTIRDYLFDQDNELLKAISLFEEYTDGDVEDSSGALYQALVNKLDALQAWDFESQIKQILGKLGVHGLSRKVDSLSGGERKRVALAKTLVEKPDFLILDEPTNHLDITAIEWLEQYLSAQSLTLLLVTHDRYFLEEVTNGIMELENANLYQYKGNYSYFIEKKAERKDQESTKVAKAKNLLVKELDWLHRMPKARGSKAKYRIDSIETLQDVAATRTSEDKISINIKSPRQGKNILAIDEVSKSFDDLTLIRSLSYTFKKRERVGIVGANGSGKTTLLRLITGELQADEGHVTKGETTRFGYYRQDEVFFRPGQRVIDIVTEVAEVVQLDSGNTITAAQFLQHFLFPPKMHQVLVEKLSGGEKRRLQLLRVLIEKPNFLILDEPTNDLDIYTLNVLEDYLEQFEGSLVVVSHDRYFMDKLTDHLFVFTDGGKILDFPGNYSDYRNRAVEDRETPSSRGDKPGRTDRKSGAGSGQKKRRSYKEEQEFHQLEKQIESLEIHKEDLLEKMNRGTDDHELLNQWSAEFEKITREIDEMTDRWIELSEYDG